MRLLLNWTYNHVGYDIYHEGIGLLSKTPLNVESLLISESHDPSDYHTRKVVIGETIINDQKIIVAAIFWWQTTKKAFA